MEVEVLYKAIIETRVCTILQREDGIVTMRFKDDVEIGKSDIDEMINTRGELSPGKVKILIVTGIRASITKEARQYNKEAHREANTQAEALVVRSLPTRIAVNFYYRIRRTSYPVKIFRDEVSALKWLKSL